MKKEGWGPQDIDRLLPNPRGDDSSYPYKDESMLDLDWNVDGVELITEEQRLGSYI